MKRLINHVNSKPEHIRHLVAIGCTVVVGAIVLGFWLRSFQKTTYALLNPGQEESSQQAQFATSSESLFAHITGAFSDIKAQISGLFAGPTSVQTQIQQQPAGPAYSLPVSDER